MRSTLVEPWLIFTERDDEVPRRGYSDEDFQKTLDHLRKRGDKKASYQLGGAIAIVEIRL